MPLIPQQAVVTVKGNGSAAAAKALEAALATFPDCRITSISLACMTTLGSVEIVAVVESV